jgi:6-phosphogluconolactonase
MTNLIRSALVAVLNLTIVVAVGCTASNKTKGAGGAGVAAGGGVEVKRGDGGEAVANPDYHVYVGTFTNAKSKGVYLMSFDSKTGKLSSPTLAVEGASPSFEALHPNHRFIYSVNEINNFQGKKTGSVSAFEIEENGTLKLINQEPSAGTGPTHISIDPTGKCVLVANYAGGSVAAFRVKDDGSLEGPTSVDQHWGKGSDRSRQEAAHAHSIYPDPDNRFVLSCDLGLDKVFVYDFDPNAGTITYRDAATVDPGSGPRHLAFAPQHHAVYVLNEMACTVTAFHYDGQKGALQSFQTISTLPGDFHGNKSTAEIFVHPNGKFVYASNRGDANSITVFSIGDDGKLTFVDRTSAKVKTPRGFGIDPTGNWLIAGGQDSSTVAVFKIDQQTGKLTPTGQVVDVPTPVCFTFVPTAH